MTNNKKLTDEMFAFLYHEHSNLVRKALLDTIPSLSYDDELDELEQDVWLRVWEKRHTWDGDLSQVTTWIHNVATSIGKNYIRDILDKTPEIVVDEEVDGVDIDEEYDGESWIEQQVHDLDGPEELAELAQGYSEGLSMLSSIEEDVYHLVVTEHYTPQEAADALNISRNYVDVIVFRIKNKLFI